LPSHSSYEHTHSFKEKYSVVIDRNTILNLEGDGTLTFSESLLVEGKLIGGLRCLQTSLEDTPENLFHQNQNDCDTKVKIGMTGEIHADITCVKNVEVLGVVKGNIHCHSLVVGKHASIIGDITVEQM
jgi:cytoskeletal protein CcmA (bactofilin family)